MKKLLLLLAVVVVHTTYTYAQTLRKTLLEQFTCTQTGWCGEGILMADSVNNVLFNRVITVNIHCNYATTLPDTMALAQSMELADTFDLYGYPSAAIDRVSYPSSLHFLMNRNLWYPASVQRLLQPAIASISFSNTLKYPDGHYEADVNVNFSMAPMPGTPINLQVYVVEDSIPATPGTPFEQINSTQSYVQGGQSPLLNWYHNDVARAALGGAWGFTGTIPAVPALNTAYTQHISFTPSPDWVLQNLRLVAFAAYNGNVTGNGKEVINAEEMSFPSFIPSGIHNYENSTHILNVYPNPASLNDFVKLSFNTNRNADIKLEVYNLSGQLIAKPYHSRDAAGIHTIRWSPASYNMIPGIYILQLSDGAGIYKQSISIR